jgi:type III restriction enzyme
MYPDFLVMTESGNLVVVEVKGPHLDGTDSQEKAELGKTWADMAGTHFKYFMVFKKAGDGVPGAMLLNDFLNTLVRL